MPDIDTAVVFTQSVSRAIKSTSALPTFTYRDWSCPELESVRSFIRAHYRGEQGGLCSYCRKGVSIVSSQNCHVEHIAPKAKYPQFMFEPKNLCVICADCNAIK